MAALEGFPLKGKIGGLQNKKNYATQKICCHKKKTRLERDASQLKWFRYR